MGITGLLPLLKSIQQPIHIKEFAGQVVAVDGYVWLHRGAISCAVELALNRPTSKYVEYAMRRVRMLQHYGVHPYVVLDGAYLPSKAHTETSRRKARHDALGVAVEMYKTGQNKTRAFEYFQKAIDVTPAMAGKFINALEAAGVPYVVAPYEADAQLAYLEKRGLVSAVISEDSDLLVFGCKTLLTKLTDYGDCVAIRRDRFSQVTQLDLSSFTDTMFRHMAIFAGCDYSPGIPNVGLKRAHAYLKRYRTPDRALHMMALDGKIAVPPEFKTQFDRADKTFLYQRVYDPVRKKIVHLIEPDIRLSQETDYHIGPALSPETATGIATGHLDPVTKLPLLSISVKKPAQVSTKTESITNYFKRQTPLTDVTNKNWVAELQKVETPFGAVLRGQDVVSKRLKRMDDGEAFGQSKFFQRSVKRENDPGVYDRTEYTQQDTRDTRDTQEQDTQEQDTQEQEQETDETQEQETEETKTRQEQDTEETQNRQETETQSSHAHSIPFSQTRSFSFMSSISRPTSPLPPAFFAPKRSSDCSSLLSGNRFVRFSANYDK
ncbi:PIN domain-like protein [Lipomyces arxii]|uniref:PIN domain-like protein n=1 Tax=Lipomyces arxii TaxID=56418 RepID=UPI0034CD25B4